MEVSESESKGSEVAGPSSRVSGSRGLISPGPNGLLGPRPIVRLPHLFANWSQITQATGTGEVISVRTNLLEELESIFVKQRLEVVDKEGFLITPLHIVKKLAEEYGQRVHSEVYVIHHGGSEPTDLLMRVEIFCGQARGIGQAPVRGLAFQLAAIDMLEKMKFYNKEKFPTYGLPPGARIHPKVMSHLMALCRLNHLDYPRIEVKSSGVPLEERELFDCFVRMGGLSTTAKSDSRYMARRLAVKEMYDMVAREPYPEMPLSMGSQCVGLARLRELGIRALMSTTKRDWLKDHRTTEAGKLIHFPEEEPDDGDMINPDDVVVYELEGAPIGIPL